MSPITIDGSQGEGGGQILRSSLALSLVTGKAFRIENIRAKRDKPGLLRQHYASARAAEQISNAKTQGIELKSTALEFAPGKIEAGNHSFVVGSAGSTALVLQTILPALAQTSSESSIQITGGTHNPMSPPFDFVRDTFAPVVSHCGWDIQATCNRYGFYPVGGGTVSYTIKKTNTNGPINLLERGPLLFREAYARVANIPFNIAEREIAYLREKLELSEENAKARTIENASGPGNFCMVQLHFENIIETFIAYGRTGVSSERVAEAAVKQIKRYLKSNAPVGDYLADQLLLPICLGPGGSFRTTAITPHFETNAKIIKQFLDVDISWEREDRLSWVVNIEN
ncbi:RNA 3'-terminal phosphate cyclase [Puniceicoccaceae bacterium K14]|nr:RNA 3'-terminal phosphate cyclase [Puniceicoccaceae bacterium K14]